MLEVVVYTAEFRDDWNRFLGLCKNRHFMFHRDYMEYHADKYMEFSLLIYNKGALVAILPANRTGNDVVSHEWLSFGGILYSEKMTSTMMLDIFEKILCFLSSYDVKRFLYKAIPHIYHEKPCEEDLYALFRNNANLYRRDLSSVVDLSCFKFSTRKRRYINKARSESCVSIHESSDYHTYWHILCDRLKVRYGKNPVHSIDEIIKLKEMFKDNIKLYTVNYNLDVIGGVVVFENGQTVHSQYISGNEACQKFGGLDVLFSHLLTEVYADRKFFSFGISTEQDGQYLNEGLVTFKEGFGGRAVVHDFYCLNITQ